MSDDYFDNLPEPKSPSASDFFASGSPSCRFENIGDMHTGEIIEFEEAQQRDIKSGQPKFWPDGNKCMMLVITLATKERDPEIDDDDGHRRLYVNKPSGMFAAIKQAIGKNKFEAGAHLAVKYVKDGVPKQAGFSKPKEYVAKYIPLNANGSPQNIKVEPTRLPPADAVTQQARRQAWEAFKEINPGKSDDDITQPWRDLINSTIEGKNPSKFTASDWRRVHGVITAPTNPLEDAEPAFDESGIPL